MTTHTGILRCTRTPDGAAILDIASGTLTTLNPTGSYIWQALKEGRSEDDIVSHLSKEAEETLEVVARDVRAFIEELRTTSLLP